MGYYIRGFASSNVWGTILGGLPHPILHKTWNGSSYIMGCRVKGLTCTPSNDHHVWCAFITLYKAQTTLRITCSYSGDVYAHVQVLLLHVVLVLKKKKKKKQESWKFKFTEQVMY